jgi:hypothetical protein
MPLDTPRKDYNLSVIRWQKCRDVLGGEDAIKHARELYLPRLNDTMTPQEYDAYQKRASFYNGTARTRLALVGTVFWKDATVNAPDTIKPHLQDVTNDGMPLNDFALLTLEEIIGVGRYGLLVDMPPEPEPGGDRPRPYWVGYEAEQIINWSVTKIAGEYRTSMVVLKECVEERDSKDEWTTVEVIQYRVLRLLPADETKTGFKYQVEIYRVSGSALTLVEKPVVPLRMGKPLDFIPFVFMNPSSTKPCIEKPPLLDMVHVNLSHYRTSADLEHGEHFLGLPTPWVVGAGDKQTLPLGPNVVWKLSGPNAQAGLLEFKGEGLKQLEAALKRKEEQMATLGARLVEQAQAAAETAESVKARNAASHATLAQMVSAVSLGLTTALRWHVWWFGLDEKDENVTVELNREFVAVTLTAEDVKAELLRWQSGGCSFETFFYNMTRGGRNRPGIDVEEERGLIDGEEQVRAQAAADALKAAAAAKGAGGGPPPPKPGAAA